MDCLFLADVVHTIKGLLQIIYYIVVLFVNRKLRWRGIVAFHRVLVKITISYRYAGIRGNRGRPKRLAGMSMNGKKEQINAVGRIHKDVAVGRVGFRAPLFSIWPELWANQKKWGPFS